MENQEENKQPQEETKEFDTIGYIKYLLANWKFIAKFVAVFIVLAFIVYLCKPNKYTASASILPISQSSISSKLGELSSMASLAGFDLSDMSNNENIITAKLYPAVAESSPFLLQMIDIPLKWDGPDSVMTFYEHTKYERNSIGKKIFRYTIGLPGTIKRMIAPPPIADFNGEEPPFITLDKERRDALMEMQEMISVEEELTTGLISISTIGFSPQQCAQLATQALDILQTTISNYKTKRARLTLDFIEERYEETLAEYEKVREAFFAYKDTHRDMLEERVDVEYQRLSDEYQISYSVLNTLTSQKEQAKLLLMENTPVFSVVEPVVMPEEKTSPKLVKHLFVGVFLGGLFSIGWLIAKIFLFQFFAKEKFEELYDKYNSDPTLLNV